VGLINTAASQVPLTGAEASDPTPPVAGHVFSSSDTLGGMTSVEIT